VVKLGFIVEGGTEKIIIESPRFSEWLNQQGFELINPVIDAEGGGNLLPQNIEPMVKRLNNKQAEHIIILTDLEYEVSVEVVKQRIGNDFTDLIFVAVKAIEAWFLADSQAMQSWLKQEDFYEGKPEETDGMPWNRLNEIAKSLKQRGTGPSKPAFAKKMVQYYDFDVTHAAKHGDCYSAEEFCLGIASLNKRNKAVDVEY